VAALRAAIAERPEPKDPVHAGLVFMTAKGQSWYRDATDSPVSKEMVKLLEQLNMRRRGLTFYALRHTFETIGGESRDQVAVDHIMGHVDASMSAAYRERISDERLRAVTNHVRAWLWPPAKKTKAKGKKASGRTEPAS
jgi:integrase